MITCLAVAGYRSLRNVTLELGSLNIVTGANGSGKSSLYRALRLLSDAALSRAIASLAAEGGLASTLWAGPERFSREMRAGTMPVQGTVRAGPVSLRLGFASDDFGYAIDLGLPIPSMTRFSYDPEIKLEAVWTGPTLGRSNLFAERRGKLVRVRTGETGEWHEVVRDISAVDSMIAQCADTADGLELLILRERMRAWRFYDDLRTDRDAPSRRPQVGTFTPVLAGDGSDIGAAVQTIIEIGDAEALRNAIADAFDGAMISVGDRFEVEMRQHGLLRPLSAPELSDGTLRYILLAAALLSPRPPELMILNEPEASLHPDLLAPLARLLVLASTRCQIIVVSHAQKLVSALMDVGDATQIELQKNMGETTVVDASAPVWKWPSR
ncbi:AAA family ATPase (plasmid) [Polymorphobacter sp. PAMC 29334]|uniref:AAA family ATPase n=1 Tax=Polymorphobacter sp. PAMC 29334 TaxID=2862331 RepID=UPI001C7984A8|nr:AAA family ATPase [Polymorphobacter sp. PAMC 29334]QYE33173.1 AAA family ATPase [Polymorphobacter sp. PAMC 29334]